MADAKLKIIGKDNFGRESVADFLVCDNVANDYVGKVMVGALNDKLGGESANCFFELVPADHKLWGGMAELV
jgi:hypothetical protein